MSSNFELDDVEFSTDLDLTEDEINEILDSGDPVRIDQLLSGSAAEPEKEDVEEGEPSSASEEVAESEEETPEEAEEPEKVLLSKDGKHQIPYEVLADTRAKLQQVESELNKIRSQDSELSTELEKVQRLNNELKKQLERNNIQPDDLPENFQFSEEFLAELDEYGEMGKAVRALVAKMDFKKDESPRSEPEPDESAVQQQVSEAISRSTDLTSWQQGDPDRWQFAVSVDEKLRSDPAFENASFDDRFAEVVKRTKAAFGDSVKDDPALKEKAQQKIDEAAKNQFPQSLTDVGRPPSVEKSLAEELNGLSDAELQAKINTMSESQVEALLASLG